MVVEYLLIGLLITLAAAALYNHIRISVKVARMEGEMQKITEEINQTRGQIRTESIKESMDRSGVETRISFLEKTVEGITVLIKENIRELHELVKRHDARLERHEDLLLQAIEKKKQ